MSAPSHQQHSSSRSNSRMDPRPHAGGAKPTTPSPKHYDIDMYIVRGWATTPRRHRPWPVPLDQDHKPRPSLRPAEANHPQPTPRHAWGRLRPAFTPSGPSNPRSSARYRRRLLVDTVPTNTQADPPRKQGDTIGPLCHSRASGTRAQGHVSSAPWAPRSSRDCRGTIGNPLPKSPPGGPSPKCSCALGSLCHPGTSSACTQGDLPSAPRYLRSSRTCRLSFVDAVPTDAQGHPPPKPCCTIGRLCHPGASSACIGPF